MAQLVGPGEQAVSQARILLLIAERLVDVGQQVLRRLVLRLGIYLFVRNLTGVEIPALVLQLAWVPFS